MRPRNPFLSFSWHHPVCPQSKRKRGWVRPCSDCKTHSLRRKQSTRPTSSTHHKSSSQQLACALSFSWLSSHTVLLYYSPYTHTRRYLPASYSQPMASLLPLLPLLQLLRSTCRSCVLIGALRVGGLRWRQRLGVIMFVWLCLTQRSRVSGNFTRSAAAAAVVAFAWWWW